MSRVIGMSASTERGEAQIAAEGKKVLDVLESLLSCSILLWGEESRKMAVRCGCSQLGVNRDEREAQESVSRKDGAEVDLFVSHCNPSQGKASLQLKDRKMTTILPQDPEMRHSNHGKRTQSAMLALRPSGKFKRLFFDIACRVEL